MSARLQEPVQHVQPGNGWPCRADEHHYRWRTFKWHPEVGRITIWMPDYGQRCLPIMLWLGLMQIRCIHGQDMSSGSCHVRNEPDCNLDAEAASYGYRPCHSRAYVVEVYGLEGLLHVGNRSDVWLGLCKLPMDDYHPDTATVFQFHGCLFQGHNWCKFENAWLSTTAQERQESTEKDKDYLRITCGYTLVIIREWE